MDTNTATSLPYDSTPPLRTAGGARMPSRPPTQGRLILRRHEDGRLLVESREPAADPTGTWRPVEHLAMALGGCLSEFAVRFLERRQLPGHMRLDVFWLVSAQHCRIDHLRITLHIDAALDEPGRQILYRMLDQCPVHKALQGNVEVTLDVVEK